MRFNPAILNPKGQKARAASLHLSKNTKPILRRKITRAQG